MFIIIIIFKIIIFFYIQIHYKMSRVLEIGYLLSVNALCGNEYVSIIMYHNGSYS